MTHRIISLFIGLFTIFILYPSNDKEYITEINFNPDEFWWGGAVALGSEMPYMKQLNEFNLALENRNNQVVPLLLSNNGRYIWSEKPFYFEVKNNSIIVRSEYEQIEIKQAGNTLRDAYLKVSSTYFPPNGVIPDPLFFSVPQYNTWIELIYNQNQKDVLNYANNIIANGLPQGILMIDDNWQKYYGNFEFKPDKFPAPKIMVDQLHEMGFKIMLWICPFVSPDTPEYRELASKGYLIKKKGSNQPAIINWWNGQSACYDFTNEDAKKHYIELLKKLQADYGIDGFKFDAGDNSFYNPNVIDSFKKDAISTDHVTAWQEIGLLFLFNEYRAGWKMGGQPLVERLGDKAHTWTAVQNLIPEMLAAGLLGYSNTCPDMIGGGSFTYFQNVDSDDLDQAIIVRSAQVHALMPMMQFSVAPWRVLNEENFEIVKNAALLHQQFGDYILQYAKKSSVTGEPIVRHMEYAFPNQGFAQCKDQFMLGDKYLVAPIVTASNEREVKLPAGKWRDDKGKIYEGEKSYKISVPLSRLLYFEKII